MGAIANTSEALLKGETSSGGFLVILLVSMVIAALIGIFLTYFVSQKKKSKGNFHSAHSASETHEKIAVAETTPKENAAKTVHHLPAAHDAANVRSENKEAHDTVKHAELRHAIGSLDVLPAMPVIAQKLLSLNLNTEEGERMMLVLIAQDPQISAKIIGLANSAMIGASHRIISVRDAALLLGAKRVQSVAASIAIISLMAKAPQGIFKPRDLWVHGFRVAAVIQCMARFMPTNLRPSDEQIFLAGTLHDIGYLVLAHIDPKLSDKLHSRISSETAHLTMDIEHEILDICHDELGAELARHWNLPEEIISALRYHHYPEKSRKGVGQILARMINVAQKLLSPISSSEITSSDISSEDYELLGIPPTKEEELKEQIFIRAEQATQFANSIL